MSSTRWEPLSEYWDYEIDEAEVRRVVRYNGKTNGIGIRMHYKRPNKVEFGGVIFPPGIAVCRQVEGAPVVEMTEARVEMLERVFNLCQIAMWTEAARDIAAMLNEAKGATDER